MCVVVVLAVAVLGKGLMGVLAFRRVRARGCAWLIGYSVMMFRGG